MSAEQLDRGKQEGPGKGLFGWLGRQFGYVRKAVKSDVTEPRAVWRKRSVEQQPMPGNESMTLRRTTIDEVIVKQPDQPKERT